jgi:histidinol-phosphate/aromatic aminotransferase/cobyric acid decarboxylase-like protein
VGTIEDMTRFVQPHLRGRITTFAAGRPPAGVLRLDLNEGAYGPTPAARAAIAEAVPALQRYPDATAGRCASALRRSTTCIPTRSSSGRARTA